MRPKPSSLYSMEAAAEEPMVVSRVEGLGALSAFQTLTVRPLASTRVTLVCEGRPVPVMVMAVARPA